MISGASAPRLRLAPLRKPPTTFAGMLITCCSAAIASPVDSAAPAAVRLLTSATTGLIAGPAKPIRTPLSGEARKLRTWVITCVARGSFSVGSNFGMMLSAM